MIENLAFKGKLVLFGLDWFSFVWFGFLSAGSLDYAGEEVCKIWLQLVEKLMRYDTKHSSSLSKNVLHSTYKWNFWHIEDSRSTNGSLENYISRLEGIKK